MVICTVGFVVVEVKVVIVDHHSVEKPSSFDAVVIELFADHDVVQGFTNALMNMGVIDVT